MSAKRLLYFAALGVLCSLVAGVAFCIGFAAIILFRAL